MDSETIKLILTATGLVLALITTIITAIAKNCKSSKTAKTASNLLKVIEAVQTYVTQAESLINFTGANKKEWVMTKVNQFCISKGISYEQEQVDGIIESLIDFSKNVNARKEEKL